MKIDDFFMFRVILYCFYGVSIALFIALVNNNKWGSAFVVMLLMFVLIIAIRVLEIYK